MEVGDDWETYEELAIQNIHEALNACLNLAAVREATLSRLKESAGDSDQQIGKLRKKQETQFKKQQAQFEKEKEEFKARESSLQTRIRDLEDRVQNLQDVNHFLEEQLNSKEEEKPNSPGRVASAQLKKKQQEVDRLKDLVKDLTNRLRISEDQTKKMETENEFWSQELKVMTERKEKLEQQLDMWKDEMERGHMMEDASFMDNNRLDPGRPEERLDSFDDEIDDIHDSPDEDSHQNSSYVTPGSYDRIEIESVDQIQKLCKMTSCPPDFFQMFREALADFIQSRSPAENARIFGLLVNCNFGRSNANQQLKLADLIMIVRSVSFDELKQNWTQGLIKRLLTRIFDTTEFGLLRDNQIESYVQMTHEIFLEIPDTAWYLKLLVHRITSRKNVSLDKLISYIDELLSEVSSSVRFRECLTVNWERYTQKLVAALDEIISSKGVSRASKQAAQSVYIKIAAALQRKELLNALPYWRNDRVKYEQHYALALQNLALLT